MFYLLFEKFSKYFFPFNVFKYITFRAAYGAITALIVCLIIGPFVIKRLKKLKVGENIREEIQDTHNNKAGTPTMGGLMILISLLVSTILWARFDNPLVWVTAFSAIWFGGIGFIDDYMKLTRKSGLKGWYRIIAEAVGAFLVAYYMYAFADPSTDGSTLNSALCFPFFKNFRPDLHWLFVPFAMLVIVGSANAVNLTDGLDGLAIGCTLFVAAAYTVIAYITSHYEFSNYLRIVHLPMAGELSVLCAALTGASLGFLWYNSHPAQIFMGDTGALALGGVLGSVAVLTKNEIILFMIGGIFVAEVLSVIIQVVSFQTRGKRIFKRAPFHHHFRLTGWSESKVVIRFWIIGAILLLLTISTLKLR